MFLFAKNLDRLPIIQRFKDKNVIMLLHRIHWVRNDSLFDYLNSLQVGQQQVLALLLALDGFFLLSQPGLHKLQHVSLLTQILSATLRGRRRRRYVQMAL